MSINQNQEENERLIKNSDSSVYIELDQQDNYVENKYIVREENIQTFNFVKVQFFGMTFFCLINQLFNIALSFSIMQVLNKNDHTFSFIFLILFITQLFYFLALIIYKYYFRIFIINNIISVDNILDNLFRCVLYIGLYLYSISKINTLAFQLFILPGFIYCFFDLLFKQYKNQILDYYQAYNLLFWIQVQLIYFNIFFNLPWSIVIIIWTVQYFLYKVFSYLIIAIVILSLVVLILTCKCKLKFEFFAYSWLSSIFLTYAISNILYFNFVLSLTRILQDNLFKNNYKISLQSSIYILNNTTFQIIISMIILMPILIILYLILAYKLKKKLIKKEKIYQIYTLAEDIRLKLIRKSTEYFKKNDNFQEELDNFDNESYCVICKDQKNEIILRPCGHTSICTLCLKQHLEHKNLCPYCRKKIQKAYVIKYDKQNKAYYVKKVIKLNNQL